MVSAIIEIDPSAATPGQEGDATGRRRPVLAVVAVTTALALILTGPALVRPTYLPAAWRMPASTGFFWPTAEAIYMIDRDDGAAGLSARDPRSGERLWRVRLTGPLAEVYQRGGYVFNSNFPPTPTDQLRTDVFETTGGLSRLAFPAAALPLAYIADNVAISIDRDLTVAPDASTDGQEAARGLQWTHLATAYDLGTGAWRWSRPLVSGVTWSLPGARRGAAGIAGLPQGQNWMVTTTTAGVVEVWDLDTGATRVRREIGAMTAQSYVTAVAGAVVARIADDSALTAFEPLTLTRTWRLQPPIADAEPVACEPLLCLVTQTAVVVVDPLVGGPGWRAAGPQVRPGLPGRLLLMGYGAFLTLVNTRNGDFLPVDGDWRAADEAAYTRYVVITQFQSGLSVRIALLDAATGAVRPVGLATGWSARTSCAWADDYVACADAETLRVWRLSALT